MYYTVTVFHLAEIQIPPWLTIKWKLLIEKKKKMFGLSMKLLSQMDIFSKSCQTSKQIHKTIDSADIFVQSDLNYSHTHTFREQFERQCHALKHFNMWAGRARNQTTNYWPTWTHSTTWATSTPIISQSELFTLSWSSYWVEEIARSCICTCFNTHKYTSVYLCISVNVSMSIAVFGNLDYVQADEENSSFPLRDETSSDLLSKQNWHRHSWKE